MDQLSLPMRKAGCGALEPWIYHGAALQTFSLSELEVPTLLGDMAAVNGNHGEQLMNKTSNSHW